MPGTGLALPASSGHEGFNATNPSHPRTQNLGGRKQFPQSLGGGKQFPQNLAAGPETGGAEDQGRKMGAPPRPGLRRGGERAEPPTPAGEQPELPATPAPRSPPNQTGREGFPGGGRGEMGPGAGPDRGAALTYGPGRREALPGGGRKCPRCRGDGARPPWRCRAGWRGCGLPARPRWCRTVTAAARRDSPLLPPRRVLG